jgi:hypothetical protein
MISSWRASGKTKPRQNPSSRRWFQTVKDTRFESRGKTGDGTCFCVRDRCVTASRTAGRASRDTSLSCTPQMEKRVSFGKLWKSIPGWSSKSPAETSIEWMQREVSSQKRIQTSRAVHKFRTSRKPSILSSSSCGRHSRTPRLQTSSRGLVPAVHDEQA